MLAPSCDSGAESLIVLRTGKGVAWLWDYETLSVGLCWSQALSGVCIMNV